MYDGKKTILYEIFYKALDSEREDGKEEKPALEIWNKLDNITPSSRGKESPTVVVLLQLPD